VRELPTGNLFGGGRERVHAVRNRPVPSELGLYWMCGLRIGLLQYCWCGKLQRLPCGNLPGRKRGCDVCELFDRLLFTCKFCGMCGLPRGHLPSYHGCVGLR
jgi:hypothetical protein